MAAFSGSSKVVELSKAEYLKRYLSPDEDTKKSKGKIKKKRRNIPGKGLKIVDDDVDWKQMVKQEKEIEEDEDEAPVIAEVIDDRPEEVKQLEVFRNSNRWKVIGGDENKVSEAKERESEISKPEAIKKGHHGSPQQSFKKRRQDSQLRKNQHDSSASSSPRRECWDSPDVSPPRSARHDSPDASPPRSAHHDSPDASPPRRARHDSPDASPPRRARHDSPDASPPRRARHDSPDASPPRRVHYDSSDASPPRRSHSNLADLSPLRKHSGKSSKFQRADSSPVRKKTGSSSSQKHSPDSHRSLPARRDQNRHDSDSDQSPPRKKPLKEEDSDQSPPRRQTKALGSKRDRSPPRRQPVKTQGSDSDQSPPRRRIHSPKVADDDLSPPRKPGHSQGQTMLSGGKAGLISADVLRKEQDESRRRERRNLPLENESRSAQTVFRDKSGKKRDLDSEREEQKKKAGEQAAKDEKYAQWGKGLAQAQINQQKLEDALHEAQKPLARYYDDQELDRMLREQEREGDPMAAMIRRKKERTEKSQEKPRYKGPAPPPNRFNIPPGYRWDGVDRSNGFEKKRYTLMSEKKAIQEEAYKWSVEDM
ncbi:BUD13 homolog [Thalassophryne amazonica]|uniref:BUD13 homolog n=1 Tax=Thalassophryne amazonica TaxID=390379 RepID=UPI0014710C9D|nr:BUD13 homolog [Thalassophryne amazonica]